MLESIPSIEETLNELRQQIESDEDTPDDLEELEQRKLDFESKTTSAADMLQKGSQLLEEIRAGSSEELQDVCLLDERLERLEDKYREILELWKRMNETRLIDESMADFMRDSKLVRVTIDLSKLSFFKDP